ncbi:hypothetical protein M409DRAFT_27976 [Zasmidium cellare ATCC 36951]|uniref:Uncharacterized protein n=1 Tax=Zasmidium cellare ATCC 36951 TaxID=1080233 RepID=A0A6A6C3H4_ZASCE|nr:uncharacterized protein M409DRAFT_27976 [Zasmidium cellare ATCC 36951]KAF2161581.1 hypothetical protein M409DRAFT_27976 [Zasmidium cellare ATCC 36951]
MQDVKDGKSLKPHIDAMERQLNEVFDAVDKTNKHFWPSMPRAEEVVNQSPGYFSRGDISEVAVILGSNYTAWRDTPGAVNWVKKKLKGRKSQKNANAKRMNLILGFGWWWYASDTGLASDQ